MVKAAKTIKMIATKEIHIFVIASIKAQTPISILSAYDASVHLHSTYNYTIFPGKKTKFKGSASALPFRMLTNRSEQNRYAQEYRRIFRCLANAQPA
jgi:hypothetical protein